MADVYWLWYPGDFSIHQGMLQNFQREERSMDWPAYWYIDDCNRNVKFTRTYTLNRQTEFQVFARGKGYVDINGSKYPLNQRTTCQPGRNIVTIFIGNPTGLPAIYIQGDVICSNDGWQASNFVDRLPAGYDPLFTRPDQDPNMIKYQTILVQHQKKGTKNNGVLFDFGRAVNGSLHIQTRIAKSITLCYGESETEALDVKNCYYKQENVDRHSSIRKRAFRYVFVPDVSLNDVEVTAVHEYIPKKNNSKFETDNQLINQIWNVSVETLNLCSDVFFIDGIKRDRWIWAGDALQANLMNQYSFFDEEIDKRTLLALRGQDDIKQHINTIVDYSMLWAIGILNHYEMTADLKFLEVIYPKMQKMVDYLIKQTNDKGFIYGRRNDWIFVDWSKMDKQGTVAAEQLFLLQTYRAIITCGQALGKSIDQYQNKFTVLQQHLEHYFWDEDQGAFIDSYESGKHHITRHANILAIIFDLVNDRKKRLILKNVLLNDQITQITTPYFKFFEQDALCQMGEYRAVYQTILDYWGGMLRKGAVTFWEEYDPSQTGAQIYEMYGDPYGKSLCHAWGASPIYLIGRHFIGLVPTKPGYETFKVTPHLDNFDQLHCVLPIKNGEVMIDKVDNQLTVTATRDGGVIEISDKIYPLKKDVPLSIAAQ